MIGHYTATSAKEIPVSGFWSGIIIQVDGASLVTIEAKTKSAANYESIAAIKLSDYSVVETLTADGLYMIDPSGFDFIKFTFLGGHVYYNVV